jgi:hypothetical protein
MRADAPAKCPRTTQARVPEPPVAGYPHTPARGAYPGPGCLLELLRLRAKTATDRNHRIFGGSGFWWILIVDCLLTGYPVD